MNFKNNKNIVFSPIILIMLFFIVVSASKGDDPYRIKKIVIDAGHGGKDPGACGKNSKEKDIVLSVALKFGSYVKKYFPEVEVIYTRSTDEFVELYKRAEIANKANANLFISIHANANKKSDPYGTETYVMGLDKTDYNLEVAKKENEVVLQEENYSKRYDGFDPNSPESNIIFSLYQNAYLEQSLNLASKIQNQFRDKAKRFDRGVKQGPFLVLWKTTMPSILIEIGFLSNPDEEKFLISNEGQEYIASAIFRAFREYKYAVEGIKPEASIKTDIDTIVPPITAYQNDIKTATDTFSSKSTTSQLNNNPTFYQNNQSSADTNKAIKTTVTEQETFNKSALYKPSIPKTSEDIIIFKVQIKSSITPIALKPENFNGINNVEEIIIDGIYKYTVGNNTNFKDIIELQKQIKEKIPDAFIIAFMNGKKISVSEALKQIKN